MTIKISKSFQIDRERLLQHQLNSLWKKSHRVKTPSKDLDPIYSQLYVHSVQSSERYETLPSILASKSQDTHRSKNTLPITTRKHTQTDVKIHKRHLQQDRECTSRFSSLPQFQGKHPEEQIRRKKFVEIDLLTLSTNYAKNLELFIPGGQKVDKSPRKSAPFTLPAKNDVPDFIRNYCFTNKDLNIENLIQSSHFTVRLDLVDALYFGDIKNGEKDGKGVMITPNWVYEGTWDRSNKVSGVEITRKGKYKGKFVNNRRTKVGQFHWNNGEYYSGQWLHDQKHGTGLWKSAKGDVYMGQWNKGKVEGYGVHLTRSGQKYQGFFKDFLKEGQGKQYFPNGDYFEGTFKEGKPEGNGTYKWRSGIIYSGEFRHGLREGNGKISKTNMEYEGPFSNEKAHGQGRLTVWNGDNYLGHFLKGKKHGKGILKQKRKVFVGTWKENKFVYNLS